MKNYFKVLENGKEIVAHNRVEKAYDHWLSGETYAAYIAVMGNGHRLDKRATVTAYNDNVGKGELFATYKISVTAEEFPYPVTEIGFCPYEGAPLSNRCYTEASAPAEIYGSIFIERTDGDFDFYPGENPLVQSLLGMRARPSVGLKGCAAKMGNDPAIVDPNSYTFISFRVWTSDGYELTFSAGEYTDFLVMCGNYACMRFNLAEFASPEVTLETDSRGGFYLDDVAKVSKVKTGDAELPVGFIPAASGLLRTGSDTFSGFEGYKLFTDPLCRHVALKNETKIYTVDLKDMKIEHLYDYKGDAFLCTDGEIICINKGMVHFVRCGTTITIPTGKVVPLYRDGGYDLFLYTDKLYVYRYDGKMALTKIYNVEAGGEIYRANDYSVIIDASQKKAYDFNGEIESFDALSEASGTLSDGCYFGNGYMGSFINGRMVSCDKSGGRFFVRQGKLFYFGEDRDRSLMDDFDFDDAAQAGSFAVFLTNGILSFYRIVWDGVFVSANHFGNVSCQYSKWSEPGGTIRLSIFKQGGI